MRFYVHCLILHRYNRKRKFFREVFLLEYTIYSMKFCDSYQSG